jgi:hypothetical protein
MSEVTAKGTAGVPFGLTLTQKILYLSVVIVLSLAVVFVGPYMTGIVGTIAFLALGVVLGLVTFFISAGWGYQLTVTDREIKIVDKRIHIDVPMGRIGMLVRNGGFPFPTLWLVLKDAGMGNELPAKGVDPQARQLIEAYQRRNPGRTVTYVPVPGGHLRSVAGLAAELKRRIPPLTVDERLGVK